MPYKPIKAIIYAVAIWMTGFVWGTIVFMSPSLKQTSPIPYVSSNPMISFPILFMWLILTVVISRRYLRSAKDKRLEGIKLGITLALVNFVLDLVVLVYLLNAALSYFPSLTVWVAYSMLAVIPWLTGLYMQKEG